LGVGERAVEAPEGGGEEEEDRRERSPKGAEESSLNFARLLLGSLIDSFLVGTWLDVDEYEECVERTEAEDAELGDAMGESLEWRREIVGSETACWCCCCRWKGNPWRLGIGVEDDGVMPCRGNGRPPSEEEP
jgi:hypothetical protein